MHSDLSAAIELTGVLDNNVLAYREGKSVDDAMIPIIMMLEECYYTGEPVGVLAEDEEKCFDRIEGAVQMAAMLSIGMPDDGYLEIRSEDLTERECTVVTDRGEVKIDYLVGLPQGQKMSVTTSNIVLRHKLKQWRELNPHRPLPEEYEGRGFTFAARDHLDEQHGRIVQLDSMGYCDDNTKIVHDGNSKTVAERLRDNFGLVEAGVTMDEETADEAPVDAEEASAEGRDADAARCGSIVKALDISNKRTGDFSVTNKMPRNGSKGSADVCNVHPSNVDIIPAHIESIEHSYARAQ
ncbi:hypothetical protein THAOC_08960, partial [Thalassiosira oceanica]